MYSTSAYNGQVKFHDRFYYLKKQAFATALGLALMFFMANIDYHIWQKFAVPAYITALLLSVAVLIVGDEYNGSKRWLSFGPLSFQPSEFAKCDHKECAKDEKNAIFAVCDAFDFTDCRTCGGEQFKHRNHYSWNWRCACVCGKSKVRTICMALCQRRRIYGDFSGS